MAVEIPDKSYFKIGEVGKIVGVEPYNIRYWESQFRSLRPQKTKSNQRLYRRREIELLLQIKSLLYDDGYTIAGAKQRLKSLRDQRRKGATPEPTAEAAVWAEEREAYTKQLAEAQAQKEELTARLTRLGTELSQLREAKDDKLEAARSEREELIRLVDDESAKREAVRGEHAEALEQLTAKLTEAELERAALAETLDERKAEAEGLREALAASESENSDGGVDPGELEATRAELAAARERNDKLAAQETEWSARLDGLQESEAEAVAVRAQLTTDLEKARERITYLSAKLETAGEETAQLTASEERVQRSEREMLALERRYEALRNVIKVELAPLLAPKD